MQGGRGKVRALADVLVALGLWHRHRHVAQVLLDTLSPFADNLQCTRHAQIQARGQGVGRGSSCGSVGGRCTSFLAGRAHGVGVRVRVSGQGQAYLVHGRVLDSVRAKAVQPLARRSSRLCLTLPAEAGVCMVTDRQALLYLDAAHAP